jgi:hypothetical protein
MGRIYGHETLVTNQRKAKVITTNIVLYLSAEMSIFFLLNSLLFYKRREFEILTAEDVATVLDVPKIRIGCHPQHEPGAFVARFPVS